MNATKTQQCCPKCNGSNFGVGSDEPVTMNGWYGDRRYQWGRYAGVHMVRLTGLRCDDCNHVEWVDPEFD